MSQFSLKSLFEAVHQSIVDATQQVDQAAWESIQEKYFVEKDGVLQAKTISFQLPHIENGKVEQKKFTVPVFALSKHNTIALDEMTIDFEVDLQGVNDDMNHLIAGLPKRFLSSNVAKVSIKFKGADANEGLMLLNDKAHAVFPR
jgi:hypothetical protein